MAKKPMAINISPLDDIFGVESPVADASKPILELPLSEIHAFKDHPFQVRNDEEMDALVDSVEQNGILVPLIVRPRAAGGYELIAGHRRKHAAKRAGLATVPVDIRDVDDDTAILMMVNTNVQRERVLPSERAFAYKMMVDAVKRQVGRKKNDSPVGKHFSGTVTSELVAEEIGISKNQIFRYIRLTELIDVLLALVDTDKLPFRTGVELSYLRPEEQQEVFTVMSNEQIRPSMTQATRLKEESQINPLTQEIIMSILAGKEKYEPRIKLTAPVFKQYFPSGYSQQEAEGVIIALLEEWTQKQAM